MTGARPVSAIAGSRRWQSASEVVGDLEAQGLIAGARSTSTQ